MTTPQHSISGLYAITPDELETKKLCNMVEFAIQGGARMIQYRNKAAGKPLRLRQATALLALCRGYDVPLIINDHLDLCAQVDADGLHVGATDCRISAVRRLLGADKLIGASCYNDIDLALAAQENGADYVAFGACFPTKVKPNAPTASLEFIAQANQALAVPIVGIGGISLGNAKQVIAAGADMVAVISTLFNAENIKQTSQKFSSFFN